MWHSGSFCLAGASSRLSWGDYGRLIYLTPRGLMQNAPNYMMTLCCADVLSALPCHVGTGLRKYIGWGCTIVPTVWWWLWIYGKVFDSHTVIALGNWKYIFFYCTNPSLISCKDTLNGQNLKSKIVPAASVLWLWIPNSLGLVTSLYFNFLKQNFPFKQLQDLLFVSFNLNWHR